MNSVQIHLALTHMPVILSLVGLVMLAIAFFMNNTLVTRISYVVILVAGVAALPVFFSGEGAEESVENLPGVSESVIGRHEEIANLAMISIAAAGAAALAALFLFRRKVTARVFKVVVLLLAITSGGLMAQTASLGGQIRHTEIRKGVASQQGAESGAEKTDNNNQAKDDD